VTADAAPAAPAARAPAGEGARRRSHPIAWLVWTRTALGLVTLFVVSILIFAATQLLPGNAASAVLGHNASASAVHTLELRLGLNKPALIQYWDWLSGVLRGRLGTSLANGQPVWSLVGPRLLNSLVLVALAGLIGTVLGVGLGMFAAIRRDKPADHALSVSTLAVTSLPEFVVAIFLVIVFSTVLWHILPGVSPLESTSGAIKPWQDPRELVLPVAALVIVIVPYIFRMMRAATIEALESDYVEMARLNGLSQVRVLLRHALPNALAPTIQVIGLNFLYLAGGIVLVEFVFDYPGIGQGLVNAVSDRDIPQIQFIVLVLAAFYVVMNIVTDVVALLATPRRRVAR
jgi:peptide/nickel transport system permease protein